MVLRMCFDRTTVPNNKLIFAELRNDLEPGGDGIVEDGDSALYITDDDSFINLVLNDPGKVYEDKRTRQIITTGAQGEPHVRHIPLADWKVRVRPALMRAAETTHLFNT